MNHIGIICFPAPSHIACLASIGRELKNRGYRVTVFNIPDVEAQVLSEGLDFCPIGQSDYPLGSLADYEAQLQQLKGIKALRFSVKEDQKRAAIICRYAPSVLRDAEVSSLIVDQLEPAGGTVAEFLNIPFISVCSAVAYNREVDIPPNFTPWQYRDCWWAHLRNKVGYFIADQLTQPISKSINQYRQQWKLPIRKAHEDHFSPLAQICQQTVEFDFPRKAVPECFHYTGPLRTSSSQTVAFPYEHLSGKPLIYASLGTLEGYRQEIFYCIAAACEDLIDTQLVISLGGCGRVEDYQTLPGNPLVVEYAPQIELLARARLTITHAGLNTVLESLSYGVPLVAIPLKSDQFGVATRLIWTGAGEVVPLKDLNIPRLRTTVEQVLTKETYRKNSVRLKESILRAGGVTKAADIVEQSIETGKPVLRI